MSSEQQSLVKIAQAEDTYDLLNHIAWTDVVKPILLKDKENYSKMLVNHLLGAPLVEGLTKEMLAGRIYGIDNIIAVLEKILSQGEKALKELHTKGINIGQTS